MTEPKRLIVNADDLGMHPSVNSGIFRAHRQGIVSSTTILVGGVAFNDAIAELKGLPKLGVGVHLCLIAQNPVQDPAQIPTLVDNEGRFFAHYPDFVRRYLAARISMSQIQLELEAQLSRAMDCGIKPTHVDSHQHLHILPQMPRLIAKVAQRFGIRKIRIPADDAALGLKAEGFRRKVEGRVVGFLARRQRIKYRRLGMTSSDYFFGFARGGCMTTDAWRTLIPRLRPGVTEVMVHPGDDDAVLEAFAGADYSWSEEMKALTDPELKSRLQECGVELIHYGDLS